MSRLPTPTERREPVTVNGVTFRYCARSGALGHVVRHAFDYPRCDCLRVELPREAQAKSSGALGTPDRNQDCPDCRGAGRLLRRARPESGRVYDGTLPCTRCAGAGELRADGTPAPTRPKPDWSDKSVRRRLSAARGNGGGQ